MKFSLIKLKLGIYYSKKIKLSCNKISYVQDKITNKKPTFLSFTITQMVSQEKSMPYM